MSRKTSEQWFAEYAVCHQNRVNKVIHYVCVPIIAAAVVGLLWSLPFPAFPDVNCLNWATLVIASSLIFYLRLSIGLASGMAVWSATVVGVIVAYESIFGSSVWLPSLIVFVVAWIGQFVGHHIEGKKPAFLQDLQFLLIGPVWVLDAFYRAIGLRS